MEEQVMDTTNEVMEDVAKNNVETGMSNGVAMLIGGLVTMAAVAGGMKLRKVLAKRKASKVIDGEATEKDAEEVDSDKSEEDK